MRHWALVLLLVPTAVAAAPAPQESWGKAGVTFAQYRQDAIDCRREARALDVSQSDAAKVLVAATKQLDAVTQGAASADPVDYANTQRRIINAARPELQFAEIKQLLQAALDRCLAARGYSKFRLSGDQQHRLRKLKAGSDERLAYLYSLASNPAVLQGQAIVAQP